MRSSEIQVIRCSVLSADIVAQVGSCPKLDDKACYGRLCDQRPACPQKYKPQLYVLSSKPRRGPEVKGLAKTNRAP